jgi:hypothetical protein
MSLANNLPANAADRVNAVHGRTMIEDGYRVKVLSGCCRHATPVSNVRGCLWKSCKPASLALRHCVS